jgi:lysozyme family protein
VAYGTFDYSFAALVRDETGKEALNAGRPFPNAPARFGFGDVCPVDPYDMADAFHEKLWTPAGCNRLPLGLDYLIFDGAYRFGIEPCIFWLQLALRMEPTGVAGVWMGKLSDAEVDPAIDYFNGVIQRRMRTSADWNTHKYWLSNRHQRAVLRARKLASRPQVLENAA